MATWEIYDTLNERAVRFFMNQQSARLACSRMNLSVGYDRYVIQELIPRRTTKPVTI